MTPDLVLAVVAASVAGVVALVVAYALGVRSSLETRGARRARTRDTELAATAFAAAGLPVLVVAVDGRVLHRSDEALRLGLVRGGYLAHAEMRELVASRLAGEPRRAAGTVPLVLPRGPVGEGHLEVRVTPRQLDAGHLLLEVENRSEAMRVEDVRRDFVVNVSHELKTPVGAISVLAETLEDAADDPPTVRRFAARIRQECARLQVLVTDVLELSRVQVVDGTPRHDDVEMGAVVAQAASEVRQRAEDNRIELAVHAPPGAVVVGDEDLLTTAVRNLLVNAIAYSPEGTKVSVSVARREGLVLVQVTDRGLGIPVQEQARVFERFYRVDPARSRRTGGTGLGLAIVKHVVDNHGGDVQVWSRPGQGSTFTVRLPDAGAALPGLPAAPATPASRPAPRSAPPTASPSTPSVPHPGGTP
ncbi:ATP-binding protein [Aquipuribacter hungaricus]|uniref:Sensor-like histidine kinase SenX3 n=1 Tax=Aquipuribacter hungaricus TaxID=545624 RepID=A0ABV7WDJ1_9MICO